MSAGAIRPFSNRRYAPLRQARSSHAAGMEAPGRCPSTVAMAMSRSVRRLSPNRAPPNSLIAHSASSIPPSQLLLWSSCFHHSTANRRSRDVGKDQSTGPYILCWLVGVQRPVSRSCPLIAPVKRDRNDMRCRASRHSIQVAILGDRHAYGLVAVQEAMVPGERAWSRATNTSCVPLLSPCLLLACAPPRDPA